MSGVDQGITDLQSNPLHVLVAGDALKELQGTKAAINQKLAENALQVQRKGEQTVTSVNASKDRITAAQAETRRETARGSAIMSSATRQVAPPIVSAIRAIPAPIVNVSVTASNVTKSITYQNRVGNGNGSSGGGGGSHPGSGLA
jgi:hypothetical protein